MHRDAADLVGASARAGRACCEWPAPGVGSLWVGRVHAGCAMPGRRLWAPIDRNASQAQWGWVSCGKAVFFVFRRSEGHGSGAWGGLQRCCGPPRPGPQWYCVAPACLPVLQERICSSLRRKFGWTVFPRQRESSWLAVSFPVRGGDARVGNWTCPSAAPKKKGGGDRGPYGTPSRAESWRKAICLRQLRIYKNDDILHFALSQIINLQN